MITYLITLIDDYDRILTMKLDDDSSPPKVRSDTIANCLDSVDFNSTHKGVRIEYMEEDRFLTLYSTGCFH